MDAYVLIVLSWLGGTVQGMSASVVTMQEFHSEATCIAAKNALHSERKLAMPTSNIYAFCVRK